MSGDCRNIKPTKLDKELLAQKYGSEVASKLSTIDSDIRLLYRRAVDSVGQDSAQIQRLAEPLCRYAAEVERQRRRRRWQRLMLCLAAVIVLLSCLIACETSSRFICAIARILWIKTLPYWDWTKYYSSGCVIKNPFYQEDAELELSEEDCKACETVGSIERVSNVSHSVISDVYIKRDVPVIITDATDSWPARRLFSFDFLHKLYEREEVLQMEPPCVFASSVQQQGLNIHTLLKKAFDGELVHWYAHWENCERRTVRLFRQFHSRPYCLPPMVEVVDRGWMFVSADYTSQTYKPVDISSPVMWISQLAGANKIRLTPRQPCDSKCSTLYAVLHEGEIVMWTDLMWLMDYLPSTDTSRHFNIAIGSGGTFD